MIHTNRIAILKKDNSEHEIIQNFKGQDYIVQGVRTIYLKDIPGKYIEEVITLPKLMVTPLDEDWSKIRINFNLPAWELVKNNKFLFTEREDGFDFELFDPIAKTKDVFQISRRSRSFEMKSELLDCQAKTWYVIDKLKDGRYSVKL